MDRAGHAERRIRRHPHRGPVQAVCAVCLDLRLDSNVYGRRRDHPPHLPARGQKRRPRGHPAVLRVDRAAARRADRLRVSRLRRAGGGPVGVHQLRQAPGAAAGGDRRAAGGMGLGQLLAGPCRPAAQARRPHRRGPRPHRGTGSVHRLAAPGAGTPRRPARPRGPVRPRVRLPAPRRRFPGGTGDALAEPGGGPGRAAADRPGGLLADRPGPRRTHRPVAPGPGRSGARTGPRRRAAHAARGPGRSRGRAGRLRTGVLPVLRLPAMPELRSYSYDSHDRRRRPCAASLRLRWAPRPGPHRSRSVPRGSAPIALRRRWRAPARRWSPRR